MIYPLSEQIKFTGSYKEIDNGYEMTEKKVIVVHLHESIIGFYRTFSRPRYSVVINQGLMIITLDQGFRWDGVTGGLDTEDRMLFSACHDVCCLASQSLKDKIYETMFESISYKFCRKQGCNWFKAWRTVFAIKNYDSFKNEPTDLNA